MLWKKRKKSKILPKGYYSLYQDPQEELYLVRLNQGSYQGLGIKIGSKIKIRKDVLTSEPQLLYDYEVTDYAKYSPSECDSSVILLRIIAAIVVEILQFEISKGAQIEVVE